MIKLAVGESRPKKFKIGAWLIMKFEGTNHSHSFITWKDDVLGIRKLAEARGHGGRIITNTQFKSENIVTRIYHYNISKEQIMTLEKWVWENLKPYSFKQLIGLAIMRVERIWNKRATNRFKNGDYSSICVEMSAKAIEVALGIDLPGDIEDYGLNEMHNINEYNAESGLCTIAPKDQIDRINGG